MPVDVRAVQTETASSLFDGDDAVRPLGAGRDFEYDTCSNDFTFVQATGSGLVYLSERPTVAEMGTIYPDHYEPYRFESFPPLLRKAREWVQRGKIAAIARFAGDHAHVLDVGCGSGSLLRLLKTHGNPSWHLHANEMHVPSLERLARDGFHTHPGPIQQVPGQALFDVIVLNQVIEHFSDVRSLLDACQRLLKDGGHLLIETPSTSGWDFALFKRRHWGGYHFPRHFYLFNAANLGRLLRESGMAVCETTYLASPAFWTQSLHHRVKESWLGALAPAFHLRNIPLTVLVTALDLARAALGGKTSNMRMVGRKLPAYAAEQQP